MSEPKKYIIYGLAAYGAWSLRRKVAAVIAALVKGSTTKEQAR